MPVYLPQLSRREFLKRAALAGAALALSPSVFAKLSAKPRDPDTFFFLSDTHIAADAATILSDVNMTDHLTATVREIMAWPVAPAAIIISGDLAFKRGLPGDYAAFGKLIQPLRVLAPIHLLLGNHDERENFWKAFPLDATLSAAVPQKQVSIFSSARVHCVLLDSLDITARSPGRLGEAQLKWLALELAVLADKPVIVVCHHHLNLMSGLLDTTALAEELVNHPQVKSFIHGHTHDWNVSTYDQGLQIVNLPPTAYVFKSGRPSGWVRAKLAADGAEFELRCLNLKHPEHAQITKVLWRKG